jgi:hypothetical protein
MKRRAALFTGLVTAIALAAPAAAQVSRRDHRNPVVRDHRTPPPIVPVTPQRPVPPTRTVATVTGYAPSFGAPGTIVTITGNSFQAGTQVVYGGQLIAPSQLTRTRISFAIPEGQSDGTIALQEPRARYATTVGAFDVRYPARPSWQDTVRNQEKVLAGSRRDRRNDRMQSLYTRWQRMFLRTPAARAELSLHAERLAKLERMERLAQARHQYELLARIGRATAQENNRHERAMTKLEREYRMG